MSLTPEMESGYLIEDERSFMNKSKIYGKRGDKVTWDKNKVRGHIVIVSDTKGSFFTAKVSNISKVKI